MNPTAHLSGFALVVTLLASSTTASTTQGQDLGVPIRLLKVQDYYGRRAFESSGSLWFGLYEINGVWELRSSRVSIDTITTPRGCTPEATRVSVDRRQEPLFLIQGLPGLSEGRIDVAFVGSAFVDPGRPLELPLHDSDAYRVRAQGTRRGRPGDVTFADYALLLEHGTKSQELAELGLVEAAGPNVAFAGDLDRDRRLDLIVDLRRSYVGHHFALFASSPTRRDSLVVKVAELLVSGC